MATIKYFTRTKKKAGNLTPVYCRLRSGRGIDQTAKSGINIQPDHFSNKTGTIRNVADFKEKDQVSKELRDLKNHIFSELATDTETKGNDWLRVTVDKYHNPDKYKATVYNLFSFIDNFIERNESRLAYQSIQSYKRTFYFLKEFAKDQGREIDFNDIDLVFYEEFILFLQKRNLALNSISKAILVLKIFLNAATDEGCNTNLQYKNRRFSAGSEESETIYLTEAEIQKIYDLDLSGDPALDQVRDLFIVGCWTGQRFGDWEKISKKHIKGEFLELKQQKTGNKVAIPIHSTVRLILAKYEGNLPPAGPNNNFNVGLRKIAAMAKINEPVHKAITRGGKLISKKYPKYELLSTHAARRSFATNLYNQGLDTYTIKQITGHKTEASFLKYIRVTPTEYAEKLRKFWNEPEMKVVGGQNTG